MSYHKGVFFILYKSNLSNFAFMVAELPQMGCKCKQKCAQKTLIPQLFGQWAIYWCNFFF